MQRILISLTLAVAFSAPAVAQDAAARTVQYHSQDIVPIRAKMKFTTLIQVPPTEKIMEAATGDKDFWVSSHLWPCVACLERSRIRANGRLHPCTR